ncbi:MAG: GreA/GreB family elongation factor [Gemmatimonadota bacterium]|nr:GreA/GreB family elongation factor [Gemmatimonadota bacterium]
MFDELIKKMAREVEKLTHELHVVLPNEIRKAVELGDLKENSEYKSALERQAFVQARLGQLTQRVTKLANIDIAQIPTDKVGLGSEVVVEDEVTKVQETYKLVFGDGGEFVDGQVTMSSPIGRALQGRAAGEETLLKLPTKVRKLRIVSVKTVHEMTPEEVSG